MNKIKEKASTSCESTPKIIASISKDNSHRTSAKMPKLNSMKRSVQRERESVEHPPTPKSLSDLSFLNNYKVTENGEDFLMFDSSAGDDRINIFTTKKISEF